MSLLINILPNDDQLPRFNDLPKKQSKIWPHMRQKLNACRCSYKKRNTIYINKIRKMISSAIPSIQPLNTESTGSMAILLIADGQCPKIRELLANTAAPVLWLNGEREPLAAISDALSDRREQGQPAETLHWVSHGQPGVLRVADHDIDRDALLVHHKLISEWGISELALWSCEAGAKKNFISLWQELTGAQVWSSEGKLGRNHQGVANWCLESGAASEQAPVLPVTQQRLHSWPYQLAAPVASGTPTLTAVTEDTTTTAGDNVANLFSSSFSDADSDTLLGVAISANAANSLTEGLWQFSTDNGSNWTTIPTTGLAQSTAFYLEANSKLRFLPNADFNGTPTRPDLTCKAFNGTILCRYQFNIT